jgi:CubicO group peptidase (beta-lactamase class C family)
MDVTWGLGFGLLDGGFGMGGIGGSLGWADPGRGVALAYVTTRMGGFDRAEALERALLSSVGR